MIPVDVFTEYFEVVVHSLLYLRGIYPAGVFRRHRIYNVPVQICLHPGVSSYVTNCLSHLTSILPRNGIHQLIFVVKGYNGDAVEKFTMEIELNTEPDQPTLEDLQTVDDQLRSSLIQLYSCQLPAHRPGRSWRLVVQTTKSMFTEVLHDIQCTWTCCDRDDLTLSGTTVLLPVKSIDLDAAKIQLLAEVLNQEEEYEPKENMEEDIQEAIMKENVHEDVRDLHDDTVQLLLEQSDVSGSGSLLLDTQDDVSM